MNIPAEIKLSQFIGGLEPNIQLLVKAQNPQNLAAAIAAAKRVASSGSHAVYLTQEEDNPMVTGLMAQVAELTKQVKELTTGSVQRERFPRELKNERCAFCRKLGHNENDCWFKNKRRTQCFNCKGYGHMQKDCWAKRKADTPGKGRGRP